MSISDILRQTIEKTAGTDSSSFAERAFLKPETQQAGGIENALLKPETPQGGNLSDAALKPEAEEPAQVSRDTETKPRHAEGALEGQLNNYNAEIKKYSAGGNVIEVKKEVLRYVTGEPWGKMINEYRQNRLDMIQKWEMTNDRKWPRYDADVFNEKGERIRHKGMRYDPHHMHPLGLGGHNFAGNITPMHAMDHAEGTSGIHRPGGPYDKIKEILKHGATI